MALTSDEITRIQGYTAAEMRACQDVYAAAHTPVGTVTPLYKGSLFELRVCDILSQFLPAQLAANPLCPTALQTMMTRLDGVLATGNSNNDADDYEDLSQWTATYAPAPVNYYVGDLVTALKTKNLPALVVSSTMPGGQDISIPALGPTTADDFSCYVNYILPFDGSELKQVQSQFGAEQVATILSQYFQDPLCLWMNGRVTMVQRLISSIDVTNKATYAVGVVRFTATRWAGYTPVIR